MAKEKPPIKGILNGLNEQNGDAIKKALNLDGEPIAEAEQSEKEITDKELDSPFSDTAMSNWDKLVVDAQAKKEAGKLLTAEEVAILKAQEKISEGNKISIEQSSVQVNPTQANSITEQQPEAQTQESKQTEQAPKERVNTPQREYQALRKRAEEARLKMEQSRAQLKVQGLNDKEIEQNQSYLWARDSYHELQRQARQSNYDRLIARGYYLLPKIEARYKKRILGKEFANSVEMEAIEKDYECAMAHFREGLIRGSVMRGRQLENAEEIQRRNQENGPAWKKVGLRLIDWWREKNIWQRAAYGAVITGGVLASGTLLGIGGIGLVAIPGIAATRAFRGAVGGYFGQFISNFIIKNFRNEDKFKQKQEDTFFQEQGEELKTRLERTRPDLEKVKSLQDLEEFMKCAKGNYKETVDKALIKHSRTNAIIQAGVGLATGFGLAQGMEGFIGKGSAGNIFDVFGNKGAGNIAQNIPEQIPINIRDGVLLENGNIRLPIGSRGPEGSMIDFFMNNPEVCRTSGWDGVSPLEGWAGRVAHLTWLADAQEMVSKPEVVNELIEKGFLSPDQIGNTEAIYSAYAESMRHIGSGFVEMNLPKGTIDLTNMNQLHEVGPTGTEFIPTGSAPTSNVLESNYNLVPDQLAGSNPSGINSAEQFLWQTGENVVMSREALMNTIPPNHDFFEGLANTKLTSKDIVKMFAEKKFTAQDLINYYSHQKGVIMDTSPDRIEHLFSEASRSGFSVGKKGKALKAIASIWKSLYH